MTVDGTVNGLVQMRRAWSMAWDGGISDGWKPTASNGKAFSSNRTEGRRGSTQHLPSTSVPDPNAACRERLLPSDGRGSLGRSLACFCNSWKYLVHHGSCYYLEPEWDFYATHFSAAMPLSAPSSKRHVTTRRWQLAQGSPPEHFILLWRHATHLIEAIPGMSDVGSPILRSRR